MTTPAPITVIDLMRNIAHIRMSDGAREKMRQMLHQFAAAQRAQGAAELERENAELKDGAHSDGMLRVQYAAKIEQLRAELAATKQRLEAAKREISMDDMLAAYKLLTEEHMKQRISVHMLVALRNAINAAIAAQAKEPCQHLRRQTHKSIVSPGVERDRCADCGELLSIGAAQEKGDGQ